MHNDDGAAKDNTISFGSPLPPVTSMSSNATTFVDATSGAAEHCEAMAALHPDLAADYESVRDLLASKLWHQLTLKLLSILEDGDSSKLRTTVDGTNSFLALYNEVVLSVEKKLHPLSLARMASAVATSLLPTDGTASKALLENLLSNQERLGTASTIFAESKLGLLQLKLLEASGMQMDLDHLKTTLQRNATLIQELQASQDPDGLVHSAHYQCSMVYYKAVGPPESYYQQALSYLQYTKVEQMENPKQLAVDLSLAALTGEGVFQLSEVVETPLLQLLQNDTDKQWLLELLQAVADGNVDLFASLTQKYATQIQQEPALTHRATSVQEKITLLALVHMVFERPSHERTLSFAEIAERIRMPQDQVELVIMRALSLHLMEGTMDQVDETVSVTWILSRVLTKAQMQNLGVRFGEWAVNVSQTRDTMKEQTSTLLA